MPSDPGSERAVLAGICNHGRLGLLEVDDLLTSTAFTISRNQILYSLLKDLLKEHETVDQGTMLIFIERLGLSKRFDNDDTEFIENLFRLDIAIDKLRSFAARLVKLEITRKAQEKHRIAFKELENINGSEDLSQILAVSEKPIFDLIEDVNSAQDTSTKKLGVGSEEHLQNLMENPVPMIGLPTPWGIFNEAIGGGMRTGGVTLVGARIKEGKSQVGKEVCLNLSLNHDIPTLYLDTEMGQEDLLNRCLASLSMVRIGDIETGKFAQTQHRHKVLKAQKDLDNIPLYYHSVAGKSFDEILAIIRRWILKDVGFDEFGKTKPCLVVYDYFKLMDEGQLGDGLKEYQAIGFQISKLSDFAKEYNFPCLSFVQLNRDGINKEDTSVISQSDRLLWLCHSFSIFKSKTSEEVGQDGAEYGNKKLMVLCTRYGPGMQDGNFINMHMQGELAKVSEIGTRAKMIQEKKEKELAKYESEEPE